MRFIHDLTVLLQQQRRRNPDLCLFEGSHYLYGLVTHGSFTDFEGIPLAVNYRNTSIQCCWEDPGIRNVHQAELNTAACEKPHLPDALMERLRRHNWVRACWYSGK